MLVPNSIFGQLLVIKFIGKCLQGHTNLWLCKCSCGALKEIRESNLTSGNTKTCGCGIAKTAAVRSRIHGHTKTIKGKTRISPVYASWANMWQRCTNPKNKEYFRYGGRGIKICAQWRQFANFLKDMGERFPGLTLERINNDKGYYKANCMWATRKAQANNRRQPSKRKMRGK